MYRHVLDARGTQLADVVRALLADGGLPAVIGCAAGKDRTGVTIALLLDLVGVPRDVIVEDYAALRGATSPRRSRTSSSTTGAARSIVVDSPPEFMASALGAPRRAARRRPRAAARHGVADELDDSWSA